MVGASAPGLSHAHRPAAAQALAVAAAGILAILVVNSADRLGGAARALLALPLRDQVNVAGGLLVAMLLAAAAALSLFNHPDDNADLTEAKQLAQAFVESIMGQEPEPIPDSGGMSVMRVVFKLESGVKAVRGDVVIRNLTHPFWQACIDAVDPPPSPPLPPPPGFRRVVAPNRWLRVCAVGTPGIGKTACTPYLIRMLLMDKKTVVYHVRSKPGNRVVYEFIPGPEGSDPVTANVYPELNWESTIRSLKDPSTFYVVDPGKFQGSCDPETDFRPKVIIVASPDSKHWGNGEFFKNRDGVKGVLKFFPVWELDEILHARPVLGPEMTIKEVRDRYLHVGGVPRHVFDDDVSFKEALARQEQAVRLLTTQQVEDIANLHLHSVTTFDTSQPKSALIGLRVPDNDDTYSRYACDALAPSVVAKVLHRFMKKVRQDLQTVPGGRSIFEAYTRHLMASGPTSFMYRDGVGKKDKHGRKDRFMDLGGCTKIRSVDDIIAAATKEADTVFHPIDPYHELIDFIYRTSGGHFHAFQVTLANKHSANVAHILELEQKVGSTSNLSLYYLVPEWRYETFVTVPANPRESGPTCGIFHVSIKGP